MADTYPNWAWLVVGESPSDYRVICQETHSRTSHIAIHAGGIEIGSGEVAKAVSARLGQNIYCMEGLKSSNNADLHITSVNFDEPRAVTLQSAMLRTVSYHGLAGATPETHLGGNDSALKTAIGKALEARGFKVVWDTSGEVNGDHPRNIANRNLTGAGVQLEMTTALRQSFFPGNDWSRPVRDDPKNRTPAFYAYVEALAAAVGTEQTPNRTLVWNGSTWVDRTAKVFTGADWLPNPPLYWDGLEWMNGPLPTYTFPIHVGSTKGSFSHKTRAQLPIPSWARTNDYVVSICAQQAGDTPDPVLVAPVGVTPAQFVLSSGMRLSIVAWPWEPNRGSNVAWDVFGSPNTVLMNLVYRSADVHSITMPISGISEHQDVNKVPLMPSQEFTSLYVALTVSPTLTGFAWPEGVVRRAEHLGTFGADQISLITADTPGGTGSPGALALDATVDSAAMVMVTVPGRYDGKPTWILGDATNSQLDRTTYLG
ncbi:poly-gamma-glutamate hydrolase family protein [Streptomyces uncialis]|uniref:poly-gamma-glutamate hydrolase family protein n=1 Tax=Streptomyces uncialis TaxID=1048205 RepID=UPI00093EDFD4|nr:poly-gamma-glutamate hydrolase family protein [Streptomyces uncialis]